jgi:hypothetical protein
VRLRRDADPACRSGESTTCLVLDLRTDFELKLKVKRLLGFDRATIFTESLILAQDERWRRA